jgi:hypothetical protein
MEASEQVFCLQQASNDAIQNTGGPLPIEITNAFRSSSLASRPRPRPDLAPDGLSAPEFHRDFQLLVDKFKEVKFFPKSLLRPSERRPKYALTVGV